MDFACAHLHLIPPPIGASLREGPSDAYLALNGGVCNSPKRGFPPRFKGLCPLRISEEIIHCRS